jgi:bifunctional non-homologous end joining protein LigD
VRETRLSMLEQPPLSRAAGPRKRSLLSQKDRYGGIWVEPSLLAEIEYRGKSAEGKVRHPFFKGIREDL